MNIFELPNLEFFRAMLKRLDTIETRLIKLDFRIKEVARLYGNNITESIELERKALFDLNKGNRFELQDLIDNFNPFTISEVKVKRIVQMVETNQKNTAILIHRTYQFKLT